MGLLDVINGMQNGPHGQTQPSTGTGSGSGGMSPLTMALMGLLAYKAIKSFSGQPAGAPPAYPGGTASADSGRGGGQIGAPPAGGRSLGDLLSGGLGGLIGGAAAGSVVSGGLGNLIRDLQNSGQGHVAQSWVGTGPNQAIAPESLESALGSDAIDTLTKQTGMDRDGLLEGLSQYLPGLVDHLTPKGRLPTPDEAARMS